MTGLLRKWGLGVELMFDAGRSMVQMTRASKAVAALKTGYEALGTSASRVQDGLAKIGLGLAPLGIGFGLLAHQASGLASDLEAQALTMRVLLGSQEKAAALMGQIRDYAASTPFEQGDLIEGSKRLLKLTGSNVDANMDLLKLTAQMAALNPGRSMADAAEAVLDAAQGTGFERIKELGFFTGMGQDDFKALGKPGGKAWADGIIASFREQVATKLQGGDLVAELGNTFTGRLSTLKDAFSNALLPVGEAINAELGPLLPEIGAKISAFTPVLVGAATDLIGAIKGLAAQAKPYLDGLAALWARMGTGGQRSLVLVVLGVSALVAALTPLAGAAAAVGLVVSGIASLASAIAPLIGPEALGVLAGIVAALALVAGAAMLVFEVFKREGEGPLDFLIRVGTAVQDYLIGRFERAQVLAQAAGAAFMQSFGGVQGAIEQVKPPIMALWDRLAGLFGFMQGGAGEQVDTWRMIGTVLGYVANTLVDQVAKGIEFVTAVVDVLTTTFGPLVLAVWSFMDGLFGLVTGSMDAQTAIEKMLASVVSIVIASINAVFSLLLGTVELILRQIATMIVALPGGKALLDGTGNLGADALAGARQSFSDMITEAVGNVAQAGTVREGERAKASSPTVNVAAGDTTVQANVTTEVKVNDREIARANGAAQVKAGQRQGKHLPSQQRGRVLRGNGTVTPLRPDELIPA